MVKDRNSFKSKVIVSLASTVVTLGVLNPVTLVLADDNIESNEVPVESILSATTYNSLHERLMVEDEVYKSIDKAFEQGADHSGDLSNTPESTSTTRAADKLGYDWNLSNGIPVKKNFITNTNNFSKTANSQKYIVVHDTANTSRGADAETHARYYQNNDRKVSANYTVDDDSVQYNVSSSYSAHHCGDGGGKYGITNSNSIGIEMCINSDGDYNKTYNNTILLVKKLMDTYGVPASNVVMHKDASGKNCSAVLISGSKGKTWSGFKSALVNSTETPSTSETSYHKLGKVNSSDGSLNVRSFAGSNGALVTTLKTGQEVEVTHKVSNGWLKLKLSDGRLGYVNGSYVDIVKDYPVYNGPQVGNSNLNMRNTANSSGTLVVTLPAGTKIDTVYGKEKSSDGAWWLEISALGKTGFVHSGYVNNVDLNTISELNVASVKTETYLRTAPDWNASTVELLKVGSKITPVGKNGGWGKVKTATGKEGWIAQNTTQNLDWSNVATIDAPSTINKTLNASVTENINLRQTADWTTTNLGVINANERIAVQSEGHNGEWKKVYVPRLDKVGFVNVKYLIEDSSVKKSTVNTAVNLRAEKDWGAKQLGTVSKGGAVDILDTSDSYWVKVRVPSLNNKIGYIGNEYIN